MLQEVCVFIFLYQMLGRRRGVFPTDLVSRRRSSGSSLMDAGPVEGLK